MYSGWRLAPPEFAKKLNRIVVTKMLADMHSVSVTQSEETNMLNDLDNNETSKTAREVSHTIVNISDSIEPDGKF